MKVRNCFGVHTAPATAPRGGWIERFIALSGIVKVLYDGKDMGIVDGWLTNANPATYWVGRHILLDIEGAELHNRYRAAIFPEDARREGRWFAGEIKKACDAFPFMRDWIWEGGPNEINDTTARAAYYSEGFVDEMLQFGLIPAPGLYSFGLPPVLAFDGVDGWAAWSNVFDMLDRANAGQSTVRGAMAFHEYAIGRSQIASRTHAIERFIHCPFEGPKFAGEWGFADFVLPPGDEVVPQLINQCYRYAEYPAWIGNTLYDFRGDLGDNYSPWYERLEAGLIAADFEIRPIDMGVVPDPEPPVPPAPDTPPFMARVKPDAWLNFRQDAFMDDNVWRVLSPLTIVEVWQSAAHVASLRAAGSGWMCVKIGDEIGFVASSYCEWL